MKTLLQSFMPYEGLCGKSRDKILFYEPFFERFQDKKINLLELGVFQGDSLRIWRDYFFAGHIVGIDRNVERITPDLDVHACDQSDIDTLRTISDKYGKWDIIIDDCSHVGDLTRESFWTLFPYLNSGGLYVIEDWGTGYWADFHDGAAYVGEIHGAGMVGFIHQLVDECGAEDHKPEPRKSLIRQMSITFGTAILEKA